MMRCDTCNTPDYCREHQECRRLGVVVPVTPRPVVPLPVDVPEPYESLVDAPDIKGPAPSHEPKPPMATQQQAEARAMWVGVIVAVLNAALLALGVTDADVGPAVDAVVLGQWGNALLVLMGIAMAYFRRSLAGLFGGNR